uniref:NADH dehydrogenase subunit 6 n=1 Tax=Ectatops sp. TaxID=2931290 RepID=A0A8T9ZW72_9HEMI|nr:NADH dehydrogenase subunit 6 [Ectatops sp.]
MFLSIMIMNMLSYLFLWSNHPISLGLIIILQTLNISMMTGMMSSMFWFSYIIIIIMLSGMLVLFIYMASIASNKKFKTSIMMTYSVFITLMMGLSLQLSLQPNYMECNKLQSINNYEMMSLMNMMNNNKIITLMVIYLFFSMATISFIVTISEGPLRTSK